MKLTISHPTQDDFQTQITDEELLEIRNQLRLYMEKNKTKHCTFKLEGEAELKKEVSLKASLFG